MTAPRVWVAAALCAAAAFAAGAEALRDEDIVRMKLRGDSDTRVIETIRASRTAFDLSEEMLAELRIAGISEAVLRAMRARQAELDDDEAETRDVSPAPPPAEPAVGALSVRLTGTGNTARVAFPEVVPESLAARLGLGDRPEDRAIHRAAWFAVCVTSTHVPDHWRSRSPLGRDFASAPRHEMLAFVPAEGAVLELPASFEVPVDGSAAHRLVVGLALEIGDRWRVVAGAEPFDLDTGNSDRVESFDVTAGHRGADLAIRRIETP